MRPTPALLQRLAQIAATVDTRAPQPGEYADRLAYRPATDPAAARADRKAKLTLASPGRPQGSAAGKVGGGRRVR
jgi:hypothetical protein